MKKLLSSPLLWLIIFFLLLYRDFFIFGRLPLPADTLVGSYYPWLDYKWGYPVGVPVKNPVISDAFSEFFVWKYLAVDLLRSGIPPLWNKYALAGTSLLGNYQSAVFFPGNLLLFLPRYWGWGAYIFSSTLFAGLGFYLFMRRHIYSPPARVAGSVVFALSGLMTTWVELGAAVWSMALLPIAFYCIDQILLEKKKIYLAWFSLAVAALILAGNVQVDIYSTILVIGYCLFLLVRFRKKVSLTEIVLVHLFGLAGIGLTAFQLLPSLDYFRHSIRTSDSFIKNFDYGLIPIWEMIRLWAADFFGNPVTRNYFGRLDYHETSPFLGTLTLPLVLPMLFRRFRSSPLVGFFLAVFLISLLLVVAGPLSHLIFTQPLPLFTYSYASRLLFVTSFSAAILVGFSLDQLVKEKKFLIQFRYWSLIILNLTIVALLFVSREHRLVSLRNSIIPIAILILSLAGSLIRKISYRRLAIIFTLIILLDLARYFTKHNPFVPQTIVFPSTPVIDFLRSHREDGRIARQSGPLIPPNTWIAYRLESIEGYDPLQSVDYSRLFRVISADRYYDQVSRFSQLIDKADLRYLDALNVRYFISLKTTRERKTTLLVDQLTKSGYVPVFEDGSVLIYRNENSNPRAYFVDTIISAGSEAELGQLLENPRFNPRKEAIISAPLPDPIFEPSSGEVLSLDHRDNEVTLRVAAEGSAFLILADAYDLGWRATVNGKEASIYRANGALRGIFIPAGESQVVFRYQPDSFRLGLTISALSLSSVIILLAVQSQRHQV